MALFQLLPSAATTWPLGRRCDPLSRFVFTMVPNPLYANAIPSPWQKKSGTEPRELQPDHFLKMELGTVAVDCDCTRYKFILRFLVDSYIVYYKFSFKFKLLFKSYYSSNTNILVYLFKHISYKTIDVTRSSNWLREINNKTLLFILIVTLYFLLIILRFEKQYLKKSCTIKINRNQLFLCLLQFIWDYCILIWPKYFL